MLTPPGSGKTILAEQYAFHNATRERPGLYLSTVSEPLEKLIRYASSSPTCRRIETESE